MIRRLRINRRNRRRLQPGGGTLPANATPASSIVATKWRLIFPVPVVIRALPTTWTVQSVAPTSVTQVNSTTFDLGYAAAVVATNVGTIPAGSNFIRTAMGGFANGLSLIFP
jgi:hypothetical protein